MTHEETACFESHGKTRKREESRIWVSNFQLNFCCLHFKENEKKMDEDKSGIDDQMSLTVKLAAK